MRQDFVLVRAPGVQERYPTLHALAERIHVLRGERSLHLKLDVLGHPDGEEGPCVQVKAGEARDFPLGYALFPDTLAYQGPAARYELIRELLMQRPDDWRRSDGERVEFHPEGKAA